MIPEYILENTLRSWCMHKVWCERLRQKPELLHLAINWLNEFHDKADPCDLHLRIQWEEAAASGVDAFVALALRKDEEGNTLRSSSPFCAFWYGLESWDFLKHWKSLRRSGLTLEETAEKMLFEWSSQNRKLKNFDR